LIKEALDPEEITKLEIADEADEAQEKKKSRSYDGAEQKKNRQIKINGHE